MDKFLFMLVIALCGTCTYSLRAEGLGRINNGLPAPADQFKYMVSLQNKSEVANPTRGHRCGGALISLTHVVTAAYCVFDNVTQINPADYRIFGGATLLTNDSSADRIRNIAKITVHPSYNVSSGATNDIAILTLETAFSNDTVQILNLATDIGPDPSTEHNCTFAGWGARTSLPMPSEELIYLRKFVYNSITCGLTLSTIIPESQMCAYSRDTATANCMGDEGGPLVCNNLLTGILTKHDNCVVSATRPEIYTRVFSYTEWIKSVTDSGALNLQPGALLLTLFVVLQTIVAKINH